MKIIVIKELSGGQKFYPPNGVAFSRTRADLTNKYWSNNENFRRSIFDGL